MKAPPRPPNEAERLKALGQYDLLDTLPEPMLDDLTALAAHICQVPIALISVIDEKRQWFKSRFGLSVSETPRDISFCGHTILQPDLATVPDAARDPRFRDNPLVTGDPHIRFYAGVPLITAAGQALGTLCVIDRAPRQLSPLQEEALRVLGRQAMAQLELRRQTRDLARSELLLRTIVDSEPECVKLLGPDGSLRMMNPAGLAMIEADSFGQVAGRTLYSLVAPEHRAQFQALTRRVFLGESGTLAFRIAGLKGASRWLETHAAPLRDAQGNVTALLGITREITERRRAEDALQASERKYRTLTESLKDLVYRADPGTLAATFTNRAVEEIYGYTVDEWLHDPQLWGETIHPDDRERVLQYIGDAQRHGRNASVEYRIIRKDGAERWVLDRFTWERDEQGRITSLAGVLSDITERKQAEDLLRASNVRFQLVARATNDVIWDWNLGTDSVWWNEGYQTLFGHLPEDTALTTDSWIKFIHPDDVDRVLRGIHAVIDGGGQGWSDEYRFRRRDGTYAAIYDRGYVIRDAQGSPVRMIGAMQDITERKRADDALRASEERFRQLAENIQEVFWITDPANHQMLYISPAYESIWGRTCASLYESPRTWVEAIHPDDRERVVRAADANRARGDYDETYRIQRPDGTIRWIHDRAFPVRGPAGDILRIVGTAADITEQRQSEERFRQSQKMEAIGQLAGGVAHDFNNILSAMMMQAELTGMAENLPEEVREGLRQISAAAGRAANLTSQLLQFSRKQVLQPRELDLNDVVTSLAKMLQRIIGEDVRLQLNLHPRPLITHADAGMLDQLLMNLVVNARDAMPGGGLIVIETRERIFTRVEAASLSDVKPGRYVSLRVTDTGSGIAPEHLARIFEPFFTTKEPGKGTGLGLATIFGIVKQHGGALTVESEVGRGTTFQVVLPATEDGGRSPDAAAGRPEARGGTETILLVEDDPAVRRVTRTVLERAGYRVLEAPDGVQALRLWEQHQDAIRLVLTDMVMPEGVSGRELAVRLRQRNPQIRVIYTSGYSTDVAGRELPLHEGEDFIQKPAPPQHLLETVRRSLDR